MLCIDQSYSDKRRIDKTNRAKYNARVQQHLEVYFTGYETGKVTPFDNLPLQMSGELTVKSKRNRVWDFCANGFNKCPGV